MKIEFVLIGLGILIILTFVFINLLVILIGSQREIKKSELKVKDSIRAYLDIVPLLLVKSGNIDKQLLALRATWYDNWSEIDSHWSIWRELKTQTSSIVASLEDKRIKERIGQKLHDIHESVHEYNSSVISYNNKIQKKRYKVFPQKKYAILEE